MNAPNLNAATALPLQPDRFVEPGASAYWEIGGHPNFLLSVDERVVAVRERLAQVSDTSLTVLLLGERGVGKEVLARGVHNLSRRAERPFVALNAYAIPKAAIAGELFESGGGGLLAAAGDGTLYLHGWELLPDEVRLRLVEWKRRRTIGGPDPRILLSSEQPALTGPALDALEVVRIELPPLRDRIEDIPLLANHILQKYGAFYGSKIRVLRGSFVRFLQGYRWPNNTRELERVIRRYLVIEDEDAIRSELGSKQGGTGGGDDDLINGGGPLKDIVAKAVARVEARVIARALAEARWNKKRAAADLGISYKSLLNKVKAYRIEA
ncbi:MAG: sigma 54-interacting transcriptional regulator [Gemmatimonadota bacterium]